MAVYQATGYPAISLPQGANHLPDAIVPYLNQFEKIVLWMDNDEAGKVGEEKIAYKLGLDRTFLVKNSDSDYKDANDFLLNEPSRIKEMIDKAKSIPG
jgi:twinkle protein